MHKRIAVAELELDDATGMIQKVNTIYAPEHFPVGVTVKRGVADRAAFNEWWTDRSIPASRSGIREALETLEIANTKMLLVRCYGLSLSDQYWICPEGSDLTWDTINFFYNDFSEDIGDVLFGAAKKTDAFNFSSPDNTSDGNLKKRWKIINGKRYLVKGGSSPFRQQPLNEVIASGIMDRLGIPHIPYQVVWEQGVPYSLCKDFVTEDLDLVPAWRILKTQKKSNHVSVYQHFIDCCRELGIDGAVPFLDRMIVLDYLIANEDRHFNNFGVLREAETLKWIGFAPIYDSGSSLGYDKMPAQIRSGQDITCKPFKKHHEEQLKLVSDFSWIDFERLKDVDSLIEEVLTAEGTEAYMDETRVQAIKESARRRTDHLSRLAKTQMPAQEDSTNDDVQENIAAAYHFAKPDHQ
ncbi:excisionase [Drancourtella sp. An12]|nr:excisionase [Drancourtella sp. An12]